jgi:methyl-accepting chemotaxis protein
MLAFSYKILENRIKITILWGLSMYKRKTYIINKEFQYGMIATFLIIVVCALLLFSAGFAAYYMVSDLAGERAFDEFITITQKKTVMFRALGDSDIVKPMDLANRLLSNKSSDPVSVFVADQIPAQNMDRIQAAVESKDEFAVSKEITAALNIFLANLVRRGDSFYSKDRFQGIQVPTELVSAIDKKYDMQTQAAYDNNVKLLGLAYKSELTLPQDSQKAVALDFQKAYPAVKRYELVLPPVILNNLLLMVIIIVVGIFYSHRIAGPVYRIEQDLQRVLAGEKNVEIHLRKKDKLKSIADKINTLVREVDSLRGKK